MEHKKCCDLPYNFSRHIFEKY